MRTLAVTQPQVRDYAEHEVSDDLAARVHVFKVALQYGYTRTEAQQSALLASVAFRVGQPFRLGHHTFTLHPAGA